MKETAKRRRSKAQIKADKEEELKRKEEIQAKLLAWPQLEKQLQQAQARVAWADSVNDGINGMMDSGILEEHEDGSFHAVADPVRREQNASKRKIRKTQLHQQQEAGMPRDDGQIRSSIVDEDPDVELDIE